MVKKLNNPDLLESKSLKALEFRRLLANRPDFFQAVTNYTLLGATEEQIAEFFETTRETWLFWKKHSPELRDAIATGSIVADAQVAGAMHRRATGYEYKRQKLHVKKDGHAEVIDLIEHVPPDTSAGKFWLTNRSPHWSDKSEHSHVGRVEVDKNITIEFVGPGAAPPLNITPPASDDAIN